MKRRRAGLRVLLMSVGIAACVDGTGPRPRPGTVQTEPPPSEAATFLWYETSPRVVTVGRADSIDINVTVDGGVAAVDFQPRSGAALPMRRVSESLYTGRFSPALLLFGYRTGDLHQAVGVIRIYDDDGRSEHIVVINVKDATVPTINVTSPAPGVQAAGNVVNIRHDAVNPGNEVAGSVVRTLIDHFGDIFTFAAVIEQVNSESDPFYTPVRNAATGLGPGQFDRGSSFGSAARLEGIVQYPGEWMFDLAATSNLRVIAQRWMNHLTHPLLSGARPHWPLSSLALGIMGWIDPSTRDVLQFPFQITRQSDGTHLLRNADVVGMFNDLELYLMGVLPADSVAPHIVFANQNQRTLIRNNGVLHGAVDSVRIADVVARDGPRVPSYGSAPREFRMATIVLSRNGLLTREEMSFFNYMASRGEQRFPLTHSPNGLSRGTTLPFFLATSARATLLTGLRPAGPL